MLTLKDIREHISSLGIAADDHVYIGKLDNKQQQSIGVYSREMSGPVRMALGGLKNLSYDVRPVSLLVHWTKNKVDSEQSAYQLFDALREVTNITIGTTTVQIIQLMVPEPQDVGTDDSGVYEYVILLDFIYRR